MPVLLVSRLCTFTLCLTRGIRSICERQRDAPSLETMIPRSEYQRFFMHIHLCIVILTNDIITLSVGVNKTQRNVDAAFIFFTVFLFNWTKLQMLMIQRKSTTVNVRRIIPCLLKTKISRTKCSFLVFSLTRTFTLHKHLRFYSYSPTK